MRRAFNEMVLWGYTEQKSCRNEGVGICRLINYIVRVYTEMERGDKHVTVNQKMPGICIRI